MQINDEQRDGLKRIITFIIILFFAFLGGLAGFMYFISQLD